MILIVRFFIMTTSLLLGWQGIVWFYQIPDYFLPAPSQIALTFYHQFPLLVVQALPTLLESCLGFVFGILSGCIAALSMAFFRPLSRWFLPILIISQAVPMFAIAPLLVIWLGYGLASKIAVTVLMIFFPVTSAFYDGLRNINSGWLDLAKTMNAPPWRVFWHIRIPAALPTLSSGIRIAAVYAPIGAIVGEWVGASRGLGYLMLNANARMQIDVMFAALVIIVLLALGIYFAVDKSLQRGIWWKS